MTPKRYHGVADIARVCGVEVSTVSQWRKRHPDFPAPDVLVGPGGIAGWHPSRAAEFKAWMKARPGQGTRSDLKKEE